MYARIASFEGDPDLLDQRIDTIKGQIEANWDSPPEGLESAKEMLMLVDRKSGRGLGITFYETEEDMRRGDEALSAMSPPDDGGRRTGVETYEVPLRKTRS